MTAVTEILVELRVRGVRIEPRPHGGVSLVPARLIDPDLLDRIRAHKAELLVTLRVEHYRTTADKALALLNRLKTYTLPAGRMPAARLLAERLGAAMVRWEDGGPVSDVPDDPAVILRALQGFEGELIALGGAPDPELTKAVAMVERSFPGARLVEVRKLR